MQEYKRALYDFSAAIQAEHNPNYNYELIPDSTQPLANRHGRLAANYGK